MSSVQRLPDKNRIAHAFGKAASSYDSYACLQRDIANKLFSHLDVSEPVSILDLGSGTGYCAGILSQRFPDATIISLDLANAMLRYARANSNKQQQDTSEFWLCGDAENLPFADQSFDLVISNLTIQWCENPHRVFSELFRVMKSGAQASVSTLAEQTLMELKESWAAVDSYVHVNEFLSCEKIVQFSESQPFASAKNIHTREIWYYDSLGALTNELKGIGAHNQNSGQASGLTGKSKLKKLKQTFENRRVDGKGIPVTYDLVQLHLVK